MVRKIIKFVQKSFALNLDNTDKSNILSQIGQPDVLYHLAGGSSEHIIIKPI